MSSLKHQYDINVDPENQYNINVESETSI